MKQIKKNVDLRLGDVHRWCHHRPQYQWTSWASSSLTSTTTSPTTAAPCALYAAPSGMCPTTSVQEYQVVQTKAIRSQLFREMLSDICLCAYVPLYCLDLGMPIYLCTSTFVPFNPSRCICTGYAYRNAERERGLILDVKGGTICVQLLR